MSVCPFQHDHGVMNAAPVEEAGSPVCSWLRMEELCNNKFTEVEGVATRSQDVRSGGCVCVGVNTICRLTVVGLLSCHSNVFLSNSSDTVPNTATLCQTHGTLTRY